MKQIETKSQTEPKITTNTQNQNKTRTQSEWLDWYEAHGGTKDLQLAPDEHILFHKEHGFITFFIYDDVLELHHMAGDGSFWFNVLEKVMKLEAKCIFRQMQKDFELDVIRYYYDSYYPLILKEYADNLAEIINE